MKLEDIALQDTLWNEEAEAFSRLHFFDNPEVNIDEIASNLHSHVLKIQIHGETTHYLVYEIDGITAIIIALFKVTKDSKANFFQLMESFKPYFKDLGISRLRFQTRDSAISQAALKKGCELLSLTFIKNI